MQEIQENSPTKAGDMGLKDPLEEAMASHSSILICRITWTEEPGGLQSMGSHRVRQVDSSNLACTHAYSTDTHQNSTFILKTYQYPKKKVSLDSDCSLSIAPRARDYSLTRYKHSFCNKIGESLSSL